MSSSHSPILKLWYSPGACSLAPYILLLESGLKFEAIHATIGQFSDELHQLNPKGRIPVLAINDDIITETPAILTALSAYLPDAYLLGNTTVETARVYEWLNYLSGTLHGQGFGSLWRPARFVTDPAMHPNVQEKGKQTIRECFDFIEAKLRSDGRRFAIGQNYSIVDPYLLVFYFWGQEIELGMASDYPKFTEWAENMKTRDSVIRAQELHNNAITK